MPEPLRLAKVDASPIEPEIILKGDNAPPYPQAIVAMPVEAQLCEPHSYDDP
jgi:hypothetical protein